MEQQIKDYQNKLEQSIVETQHTQAELTKVQEEKAISNDAINSLQQDLETLKAELQNRGMVLLLLLISVSCQPYRSNTKYGFK